MSKLTKYLLITFTASWIFMIIACHDSNLHSMGGSMGVYYALTFCMFIPTVGALLSGTKIRDIGWKISFDKSWKYILMAWFLPTVLQILGAAAYYLVFPDDFEISGNFLRDIDCDAYEECQANGSSYASYILREIFASLTSFATFAAALPGLGEEIGWRGFLFPELKERLGRTKGRLLGGAIHGAWHFPLIIFAGYEYGREYYGAPLLGLFAFCVFTTATGIVSDYLYEKSGSILLAGFIHGTTNSIFSPVMLRGPEHLKRVIFGPFDIGLISVLPWVFFAAGIIYFEKRKEAMELEELWGSYDAWDDAENN